MSVDIRNSEGYLDPTPYQAFLEIEHDEHRALRAFRPIVYICSPYAGDVERNVAAARKYSRFAMERGYIPIAPHLLFPQFMDDSKPTERELGLFFGNAVMSKCSEVWVFGKTVYLCDIDGIATEKAYRMARQARFEHSATSRVFPVWRKR